MEEDIKEGFLCPICFKDLKSPTNLSSHFEDFHQDDKAVLQQLRKVFGKAKQKILNKPVDHLEAESESRGTSEEGASAIVSLGTPGSGGIDLSLWHPQDIGVMFSHSKVFRDRRKETVERCVIETNQLIIRLGKLMRTVSYTTDSSLPGASKAKKNAERSCVPWQNDSDVKYCSSCVKKFTLTFRKHHCRLCGKVVCQNCLIILDINLAESVLNGGGVLSAKSTTTPTPTNKEQDFQNGLKTCFRCEELLERQNKLYLDKIANVSLVRIYDKMQAAMQNADLIQPTFSKMADSVNSGETEYGLQKTMMTRQKLLKSYETVEALSKYIQQLGMGTDKEPSPRALKLQSTIRAYASNYLADNMFTLPGLPSQDKYNEMLKEKEEERERVKKEKLLNAAAAKRNSLKTNRSTSPAPSASHSAQDQSAAHYHQSANQPSAQHQTTKHQDVVARETHQNNNNNGAGFFRTSTSMFKSWKKETRPPAVFQAVSISKSKDSSWGPVQVSVDDTTDPVVQQMKILESYIQQARDDKRWDEVKMFEQNLRELHLVYLEQKRLNQDGGESSGS